MTGIHTSAFVSTWERPADTETRPSTQKAEESPRLSNSSPHLACALPFVDVSPGPLGQCAISVTPQELCDKLHEYPHRISPLDVHRLVPRFAVARV
ncbi:unnamed protein product [Rangifer tarandus platyrhynchus]|uniref:Uncharacterized protein n=1 Tax=Rangifer tarandus platyrhynchus TaxID=3082113 RepID=A0AC59Y487_RANTA